jgi:hypothetical protein
MIDEETISKLKSNEFSAMWEVMLDILLKVSGKLHMNQEGFKKVFSPYLLCRFLSMREDLMCYADILSTISSNSKLTNEQIYKLAYKLIPRQRNCFIKYIKKMKKEKADVTNEEINTIKEKSSLFDL